MNNIPSKYFESENLKPPQISQVPVQGWQCPICRQVYAPVILTCFSCSPKLKNNDNTNDRDF